MIWQITTKMWGLHCYIGAEIESQGFGKHQQYLKSCLHEIHIHIPDNLCMHHAQNRPWTNEKDPVNLAIHPSVAHAHCCLDYQDKHVQSDMRKMVQKILSLQAVASRPRPLTYAPPLGCTDRNVSRGAGTRPSGRQSNFILGGAVAAVTFASLTRVRSSFSAYRDLSRNARTLRYNYQCAHMWGPRDMKAVQY